MSINQIVHRPSVIALLLALTTLLAYLPTLQDQFLSFDDASYVSQNANIQAGITVPTVKWAFTSFYAGNWHPLTWITHMVDYQLFRQNPAGHHFVNVLFHAANAGLLFILLLRLTGGLWSSAFVAALFAWHPLHVESVAWIAELKDVTSTFWGLLAMLAYVRYAQNGGAPVSDPAGKTAVSQRAGPEAGVPKAARYYWLSLALFAMSLMCKSMLVTLPFVLLLLDFWPLRRLGNFWRCVIEKLLFLLLAAGACMLTVLAQKVTVMASLSVVPFHMRLENAVAAYANYLWKMVWPVNLTVLYPLPGEISPLQLGLSALVLAVISGAAIWGARRQPWLLVGWLWYLGTLVPVIGLVQVGSQAMADRYTYFPLIGIFLAIALSLSAAARRFQVSRVLLAVPATLVLAACLVLTEHQLRYWHDTQTLFGRAVEFTQKNPLAHLVLGGAYESAQELDKALAEYQEVLQLDSNQLQMYQRIAHVLALQGRYEEALEYYRKAVQYKPEAADLHDSLGVIFVDLENDAAAEQEFSKAIQLDPDYAPAHFRRGWILLRQGKGAEALKEFNEAVRLNPNDVANLIYIARVMSAADDAQTRDGETACKLAERAVKLSGDDQPGPLDTLAAADAECGRFEDAVKTQMQALALAQKMGLTEDETAMQERLELYRKHQPWRKSFKAP